MEAETRLGIRTTDPDQRSGSMNHTTKRVPRLLLLVAALSLTLVAVGTPALPIAAADLPPGPTVTAYPPGPSVTVADLPPGPNVADLPPGPGVIGPEV
jgi:hypothetical protein